MWLFANAKQHETHKESEISLGNSIFNYLF